MTILGIDNSLTSPSVVRFELDNNLDITKMEYLGFSSDKKYQHSNNEGIILHYNDKETKKVQKDFKFGIDKYLWMRDEIKNFISSIPNNLNVDYVAFEDYAFAAKGQVFKLAESCGALKVMFWEDLTPYRLYNIATIKQFITGKGNADKIEIEKVYEDLDVKNRFDLSFLPMVKDDKANNPKDNVVDAFYIAKLLQTELKIRKGLVQLQGLKDNERKCFYTVTKSNPENLPVREFIIKTVNNNESEVKKWQMNKKN
jgi:Holliday junction resolvasome RuvABC endonuclease subunit